MMSAPGSITQMFSNKQDWGTNLKHVHGERQSRIVDKNKFHKEDVFLDDTDRTWVIRTTTLAFVTQVGIQEMKLRVPNFICESASSIYIIALILSRTFQSVTDSAKEIPILF